jgi:prepilin-type N-terminal cleavage/methylation domain-containing protein
MRQQGFSLVELMVTTAILLAAMASAFSMLDPAGGVFASGAEAADVQQRARAGADALQRDLRQVGNGARSGSTAGPLTDFFAAVFPYRVGLGVDGPGSFRADTITLIRATGSYAQTTTGTTLPAQSATLGVNRDPGCPGTDAACGFSAGMMAVVFDGTGSFDTYRVLGVAGPLVTLAHRMPDSSISYPSGSGIVEISARTYAVVADTETGALQLVRDDGAGGPAVPVVDNVVRLSFEYFGEPQPPVMRKPLSDPAGPWTSYGPKPPLPGVRTTAYPPGENCVFSLDGMAAPQPRLSTLAPPGTTLVRLTTSQLTDGPWCPDGASANRYDADLLRIRSIGVTLRVQAALPALRGPVGPLFARGGNARHGSRFVPDIEVRFRVSPSNLADHGGL